MEAVAEVVEAAVVEPTTPLCQAGLASMTVLFVMRVSPEPSGFIV